MTISFETVSLAAGIGLQFVDACTGLAIVHGLRCSVVSSTSGAVVARSVATRAGAYHFPGLRSDTSAPQSPPGPRSRDVLVEDESGDFLPMRMEWPPQTEVTSGGARLYRLELLSSPARQAPTGTASVFASLLDEHDAPAAWARVVVKSSTGHETIGMSDAAGQLALHLPFPRPERGPRPGLDSPLSPPAGWSLHGVLGLSLFYSPAVHAEADAAAQRLPGRVRAPRLAAWLAQPRVIARENANSPDALVAIRCDVGQPSVLRTAGSGLHHSELRLLPV